MEKYFDFNLGRKTFSFDIAFAPELFWQNFEGEEKIKETHFASLTKLEIQGTVIYSLIFWRFNLMISAS